MPYLKTLIDFRDILLFFFMKIQAASLNRFLTVHNVTLIIFRNEWPLFDRFRGQDIKLLKMLSVGCISDLMVENKKVKFGMK